MLGRRDLLKWFGAGSIVAPVIGGVALADDHVKLIETPKVEVVQAKWDVVNPAEYLSSIEPMDVTIFLKGRETGNVTRFDCPAYVSRFACNSRANVVDVMSHDSPYRKFLPALVTMQMELTGEVRMSQVRK
jgi:hypothetical protein